MKVLTKQTGRGELHELDNHCALIGAGAEEQQNVATLRAIQSNFE